MPELGRLFAAAGGGACLGGNLYCANAFGGQRRALRLGPALEFRRVGEVETVEEWTGVERRCRRPVLGGDGCLEIGDVARELLFVELEAGAGRSDVDAEIALETVDRLRERLTGALLFGLRPQDAKDTVAARSLFPRDGQDREQRERPWPRSSVGIGSEILDPQPTESSEPQGVESPMEPR